MYLLDLHQQGIRDNKVLAQMTKYHPFVVSKTMKHIDRLVSLKQDVAQMYRSLVELDFGMKTGKLPDSAFWLELKKIVYRF